MDEYIKVSDLEEALTKQIEYLNHHTSSGIHTWGMIKACELVRDIGIKTLWHYTADNVQRKP